MLVDLQLRVDGALMRLRDTRIYCSFGDDANAKPVIIREITWREATFQSLSMVNVISTFYHIFHLV